MEFILFKMNNNFENNLELLELINQIIKELLDMKFELANLKIKQERLLEKLNKEEILI